jgi:hypothetical protein
MKTILAGFALAVSLNASSTQTDNAWYVGKFGDQKCVALSSFNDALELKPAGGDGSIIEPSDMIGRFVMVGAHPKLVHDEDLMEVWSGHVPGDRQDTYWIFFKGLAGCQAGMKIIEEDNR